MFITDVTFTSLVMYVVQLKVSDRIFFPHSASCSKMIELPCMICIRIMEVRAFVFEGPFKLKGFNELRAGTCLI